MQFKPERWLDPDCTDVKEASQPFSLGPRVCLGRKYVITSTLFLNRITVLHWSLTTPFRGCSFAYLEMTLILAKILYKYDLELASKGLDWEGQSHMHVMWWKPEMRVRFLERGSA